MWVSAIAAIIFSLNFQVISSLYQYTDRAGTQHIVDDEDLVPPRYRKSVQILDDEGQVLGKLQRKLQINPDDQDRLQELKNRGRGQEKIDDATARKLLEQMLEPEEPEEPGKKKKEKRTKIANETANETAHPTPDLPEGSKGWMLLAMSLIFGVIALRMLHGLLRVLAFGCALIALMMFVGEEFGETAVGSKVKVATDKLVKPLKKVKEAAGDKLGKPMKAPYEAIDKVRNALDSHKEAAEERNNILDQLSTDD